MIRLVENKDIEQILKIYTPFINDTTISFETNVPSLKEFKKRVNTIKKNYPYLVYIKDDKVIGYTYASRFRQREAYDNCCELSMYIDPKYHGQGIGKLLVNAILEELKKQNILSAISCVCSPNIKSEGLHKSLGFINCGTIKSAGIKKDKILDIIFYEKIINDNILPFIPYKKLEDKFNAKDI